MSDTELSYTSKGTAVCKFSVACNRFFKQGEVSCWTDADGKGHSRIEIVAEHVEFKPQFNRARASRSRSMGRCRSRPS